MLRNDRCDLMIFLHLEKKTENIMQPLMKILIFLPDERSLDKIRQL